MTTAQQKTFMKFTSSAEDALITFLIAAARRKAENDTGLQLITATWLLNMDKFPGVIRIPKPPIQSVTHVKYIDTDGDQQTWDSDDYQTDLLSRPARIKPAPDESYPSIRSQFNAVEVKFVAGFGDASTDVPADIVQAIKIIATHWFLHRQPTITGTINQVVPYQAEMILYNAKGEWFG